MMRDISLDSAAPAATQTSSHRPASATARAQRLDAAIDAVEQATSREARERDYVMRILDFCVDCLAVRDGQTPAHWNFLNVFTPDEHEHFFREFHGAWADGSDECDQKCLDEVEDRWRRSARERGYTPA